MFIDEAFKQLKTELESFKSTLPTVIRSRISDNLQEILDVAAELPDKRSRAQAFRESDEGKQYISDQLESKTLNT